MLLLLSSALPQSTPAAAVGVVVVESCLWQRLTRECLQLATDFLAASWLREVIANDVAEDNDDDVYDKGLAGLKLPRRSRGGAAASLLVEELLEGLTSGEFHSNFRISKKVFLRVKN
ncbi:hypothetical protein NHJ13734_009631 [Beauveria thailandica]